MPYFIRNWSKFQRQRSDRQSSPWIKLYRSILADFEVMTLPANRRFQLIGLFLIADPNSGEIPATAEEINWHLKTDDFDFALFNRWITTGIQDGNQLEISGCQVGYHMDPEKENKKENKKEKEDSAGEQPVVAKKDRDRLFENFWKEYPCKKCGKSQAHKSWEKYKSEMTADFIARIFESLAEHKKTEQWRVKGMIPHASTWLNQRRWEAEFESSQHGSFGQEYEIVPEPETEE